MTPLQCEVDLHIRDDPFVQKEMIGGSSAPSQAMRSRLRRPHPAHGAADRNPSTLDGKEQCQPFRQRSADRAARGKTALHGRSSSLR
jgi:hypothetical protein